MLGGMRALPDDGWSARGDGSASAPLEGGWAAGGLVRHGFTHFELELQLMLYSGKDWDRLQGETGEWWPIARLEQAGLPTLFAKAARLAIASED
jgi:A/G-specific adenine glycosylase